MTALWALVADTWRQSRQQTVFVIMLILMLVTALATVFLLKPLTDDKGRPSVAWALSDKATSDFAATWRTTYLEAATLGSGSEGGLEGVKQRHVALQNSNDEELEKKIGEMARQIPVLQRSLEMWTHGAASILFTICMLFFLSAAAGYFPDLLAAGAVDLVVSKPIDRLRIFLGKYFGGLALFTVALLVTYLIMFVGLGIRFGYWPTRLFLCAPITVFSAALLYALLALVGIARRSSTLAIVLGYVFYMVIDTAIDAMILFGRMGAFKNAQWAESIYVVLRQGFPNFGLLKKAAAGCLLTLPTLDFMPVATATGWLLGSLAIAYWLFRRQDF